MWEFEKENRKTLHKLSELNEVERYFIVEFLKRTLEPIQTINMKFSSEYLRGGFNNAFFYVTIELFVEAMEEAGFTKRGEHLSRTYFNISSKSPYIQVYKRHRLNSPAIREEAIFELSNLVPEI